MKKKIISTLVLIIFALTLIPFSSLALIDNPTLYIDTTYVRSPLSVNATFDLPIKFTSSINDSGIFSYMLIMNFDEKCLKVTDIVLETTKDEGIKGFLDIASYNKNGIIKYWYSLNGDTLLVDKTLATIKFKVLEKDDANIEIDSHSAFYGEPNELDPNKIEVDFGNDKNYYSDITVNIDKPRFTTTDAGFSGSKLVKIEKRTDGATIYYTTKSVDPTTDDEIYDDGIRISNTATIKAFAVSKGISSDVTTSKKFTRVSGGDGGGGGYVIIPPAATPAATATPSKYADIDNHWSKAYFEDLINKGIINGYEDGTIRPDNQITRAEAAKLIVSAIGATPSNTTNLTFADTSKIDDWAKGYIQVAVDKGIINGYEDNTFKPTQNVSRKELVVLAMRAFALLTDDNADELTFADNASIPSWATQSIATALKLGILSGYEDNTFKPDGFVTRGESSKIISKCLELV